ncbi:carbohydrate ABC transporter permease [Kineococcus aurantiacus]|uniref:Multiple sugar transport system permease protein n=1 Tax=Kineococcus aurantiacus TaxID=37633 RepID=A0A7Y9ASB2_9ACTN|nr:carbohydrate ABC transporter permease [Kineococcus aurantiacus]NYD20574.1 multiple sugar transport system permease protein [Kineococcus aurantiacus]
MSVQTPTPTAVTVTPTGPRGTRPATAVAVYVLLVVVSVLMLAPFALVVFGAFKTRGEFTADPGGWLPDSFTNVHNFVVLFTEKGFGRYFLNSAIVSAVTVVTNVLFSAMAGYALAKVPFRGRSLVFGAVVLAMTIPYVAVFVPQFVIVVQLGLVDTLAGIVLPILVMPIAVFIMRQFASSVPDELLEAARLDGASDVGVFVRVVLPLLGPAVATVAIFTFLNSWNYFLWPLVVAQSVDTYTLPVGLSVASAAANTTDYGVLLAGSVTILVPVLVLFLFLQRYFIQGIAATGLK